MYERYRHPSRRLHSLIGLLCLHSCSSPRSVIFLDRFRQAILPAASLEWTFALLAAATWGRQTLPEHSANDLDIRFSSWISERDWLPFPLPVQVRKPPK